MLYACVEYSAERVRVPGMRAGSRVVLMNMKSPDRNESAAMKAIFTPVCAVLLLAGSLWMSAGKPATPKPASPEFERMKTLLGTWEEKRTSARAP